MPPTAALRGDVLSCSCPNHRWRDLLDVEERQGDVTHAILVDDNGTCMRHVHEVAQLQVRFLERELEKYLGVHAEELVARALGALHLDGDLIIRQVRDHDLDAVHGDTRRYGWPASANRIIS